MLEVTFRIVDARSISPWNATVGGSDGVPTGGALYEAARTMLRASSTDVDHLRLEGIEDSDSPGSISERACAQLPVIRVRIMDATPAPAPQPSLHERIVRSPRMLVVGGVVVAVAVLASVLVQSRQGPVALSVTDAEHVSAFEEVGFVQDWLPKNFESRGSGALTMFGRSLTTWTDGGAAMGTVGATRCSETVAALTNYFCGADVAVDEQNTVPFGATFMRQLAEQHVSPAATAERHNAAVKDAFDQFDDDKSGFFDESESKAFWTKSLPAMEINNSEMDSQLEALHVAADADADGRITEDEFRLLYSQDKSPAARRRNLLQDIVHPKAQSMSDGDTDDGFEEIYRCHITMTSDSQSKRPQAEVLREMASDMARIGDDDIAGDLGHVFMLHFRTDGSIAHYQSFIRYFTLKQWLRGDTPHLDSADTEASYIYDAAQVVEFFDELEAVLMEKKWTTMMDRSYAKLFGAHGAAGTAMLERSASSRMLFYCDLACVRG
jgi:hypothetical protein